MMSPMIRLRRLALPLSLLLLAGCADSMPSGPARTPPPPPPTYRLDGPFADLPAIWQRCQGGWDAESSTTTILAEKRAPGGPSVSLRAYSDSPAASGCAVTIETAAGLYVGPSFLCAADRSDERISTGEVTIALSSTAATIDFASTYLEGDFASDPNARTLRPSVSHHQIRCDLTGSIPRCSLPPMGGGYELDLCEED
jgi:hypothetical protein